MNKDMQQDFEQFLKQREKASQAYVNGDAEPLSRISAHDAPVTFFGPPGDVVQGPEQVMASHASGAEHFESSSDNRFETLQVAAGDDIAYWVGIQRATARMKGEKEAAFFNLRLTELFRREDGEWKMVHRHADFLKSDAEETEK